MEDSHLSETEDLSVRAEEVSCRQDQGTTLGKSKGSGPP